MAKEYTVISHHHGRETEFTGTIEHLINDVFGYTLECGHSWNAGVTATGMNLKLLKLILTICLHFVFCGLLAFL